MRLTTPMIQVLTDIRANRLPVQHDTKTATIIQSLRKRGLIERRADGQHNVTSNGEQIVVGNKKGNTP